MFAILTLEKKKPKRLWNKIKARVCKIRPKIEFDQAMGVKFMRIRCPAPKGRDLPWESISRIAMGMDGLLIPDNVEPPDCMNFSRPDTLRFQQYMLGGGAAQVLETTGLPPAKVSISLAGPPEIVASLALRLIVSSATVKIVASQVEDFEHVTETAMERFGATLMVTDDHAAFESCDIGIWLFDCMPPTQLLGCRVIFSVCPCKAILPRISIAGAIPVLPDSLEEYCEGINVQSFAAALYTSLPVSELSALPAEKLVSDNGVVYPPGKLAFAIAGTKMTQTKNHGRNSDFKRILS